MDLPNRGMFNDYNYYEKPLPAELASSRLWQLVYGEFRASKYLAVMRDYIQRFNWDAVTEEEAEHAGRMLYVWNLISANRVREWPTMHQMLIDFSIRLRKEHGVIGYPAVTSHAAWIDDPKEWNRLVEEPYACLHP